MASARFIVGIDLGTTNSAVAYVDHDGCANGASTRSPVPQLVGEGTVAERPTLPSFLYVGGEHDVAPGALALPWDATARLCGRRVRPRRRARACPGRLVTSAKSWLCHGGVDREAAILPWAAPEDVTQAVAGRGVGALPGAHPRGLGAALPRRAARGAGRRAHRAGLVRRGGARAHRRRRGARRAAARRAARGAAGRVLRLDRRARGDVAGSARRACSWRWSIDVGGGTTDFSLIRVAARRRARRRSNALAVGDHILLGGDNIDVALARLLEPRLGEKLDSQRWHALTNLCRAAKETLLRSRLRRRTCRSAWPDAGAASSAARVSATLTRE